MIFVRVRGKKRRLPRTKLFPLKREEVTATGLTFYFEVLL